MKTILTTRRNCLIGLAGLPAVASFPDILQAKNAHALDTYVIDQVLAIRKDRDLRLKLLLPSGSGANIDPIIKQFTAHCNIPVETTEVPADEINLQLSLDTMVGGSEHDLALPATFAVPDLVDSQSIIPLTKYTENHEPAGFRDAFLYNIGDTFDDQVYGYQTDGDAYVMFYHADYLSDQNEQKAFEDRFGIPLAIPKTWSELDKQIEFFHRPDEDRFGGLLFRSPQYLAWEWWIRFHAKGKWPLSADLVPQIDSSEGIEALEEMIRVTQFLAPGVRNVGLFENWARYEKGNVYCNIGWGGTQKYLNKPGSLMRGRMRFGPTPGGIFNGELLLTPYFNWGWSYVVTGQSRNPEIAYLFALFASSVKLSTLAVSQADGFFDPYRLEHYEDSRIIETYSQEFLEVHRDSMTSAIPDFYLSKRGDYFRVLSEWLGRALDNTVSAEEALRRVAQHWRLINGRMDQERQKERWAALRSHYPEKIRNKLTDLD